MIPVRIVFGGLSIYSIKARPEPHILRPRYQIRSQRLYQFVQGCRGDPFGVRLCDGIRFLQDWHKSCFPGHLYCSAIEDSMPFLRWYSPFFRPYHLSSNDLSCQAWMHNIVYETENGDAKIALTHSSARPTTCAICHYDRYQLVCDAGLVSVQPTGGIEHYATRIKGGYHLFVLRENGM
jgi:hypothetical protein